MIELKSEKEFEDLVNNNDAVLVYFSTPQCNVCKVLKPKVKEFISEEFEKIKMAYVNCELQPLFFCQHAHLTFPFSYQQFR